jgi:hypothetical protein
VSPGSRGHWRGAGVKYPPAEPEALRLLAPQRGLIATGENQKQLQRHEAREATGFGKTKATAGGILPEFSKFDCLPGRAGGTPISLDFFFGRRLGRCDWRVRLRVISPYMDIPVESAYGHPVEENIKAAAVASVLGEAHFNPPETIALECSSWSLTSAWRSRAAISPSRFCSGVRTGVNRPSNTFPRSSSGLPMMLRPIVAGLRTAAGALSRLSLTLPARV